MHEIASVLIAGVVVVVVDWKNSASAAPQNQANCIAQKFARWAAMWPQLKVRLRCKAGHASNSASLRSSAKSSKLQRPKICMVGCEVPSGVGA